MDDVRTMRTAQPTLQYTYTLLVDDFGDSVYKFCRSITYSKEDAEDLFQDTYLHAFGNLPKINASGNPQSFLFSTALYLWKSRKRKFARRARAAPIGPLDETIPCDVSLEDSYIQADELRAVRELVGKLPDKLKAPVVLHYTVGQSIESIACTLNIPAGTVKSRLYKARKQIEKGLEAYEKL